MHASRRCHNDAPVAVTILDCTVVQKKEDDPSSIIRFYNCEVRHHFLIPPLFGPGLPRPPPPATPPRFLLEKRTETQKHAARW
jgi:hypothetical protein